MNHKPLLERTRGDNVESIHYGSIAIVTSSGKLIASVGDPHTIAFLRSSAKPFQVLPFVESGGLEYYRLTYQELSISCASHEGSEVHVSTVKNFLGKIHLDESFLQCGTHLPDDPQAFKSIIAKDLPLGPAFNNCSGKHTAMLAYAKMKGYPLENYLDSDHPLQKEILASIVDLCMIPREDIIHGLDGCSAPTFAMPLYNAAYGMARFCDQQSMRASRMEACRKIIDAMTMHPQMISGNGEFDCEFIKAGNGMMITKRGAEGFQIVGIKPGVLRPHAPGLGIAIKVSDGDASSIGVDLTHRSRVRPAVVLEILKQLGILSSKQGQVLGPFGPVNSLKNHRGQIIGQSRAIFLMNYTH